MDGGKDVAVFDLIRKQVRSATEGAKPGLRTRLRSARAIAAIEMLARSDRRLAATTGQWDRDPMILNTPGGVVDLVTGARRQARIEDYLTKITAVGPGGECPKWMAFLAQSFEKYNEVLYRKYLDIA